MERYRVAAAQAKAKGDQRKARMHERIVKVWGRGHSGWYGPPDLPWVALTPVTSHSNTKMPSVPTKRARQWMSLSCRYPQVGSALLSRPHSRKVHPRTPCLYKVPPTQQVLPQENTKETPLYKIMPILGLVPIRSCPLIAIPLQKQGKFPDSIPGIAGTNPLSFRLLSAAWCGYPQIHQMSIISVGQ